MSDSRTSSSDNRTPSTEGASLIAIGTIHNQSSLVSTIVWYFGRLNILIGLAALGGATAILALFGGRSHRRNPVSSLSLVTVTLSALTSLLFIKRSNAKVPRKDSIPVQIKESRGNGYRSDTS